MFNKLKQFKNLRDKAKSIQSVLASESVEGSAGWGKVKIKIDGNQRAQAVSIDAGALTDKAGLETMVKDAINDAMEKIQKVMASKLKDAGGLDLAKDLQDMLGK